MSRLHRRSATVVALTCSLAVPLAAALPSAAAADNDASRASSSTAWMAAQLDSSGKMPNPLQPALPDYGLMIDALLAGYGSGDGKSMAPIVDVLDNQKEANKYFTYYGVYQAMDDPSKDEWFVGKGLDDRVGGATAKVLLAALAAGRNPHAFGGYDMVDETKKTLTPDGPEKGRIRDLGPNTAINNTNTFGQAMAVLGLAAAGEIDPSVVSMLTWQQCSQGYFRIFYSYDAATNAPQNCDGGKAGGFSEADRDSTGIALSAMLAAQRSGVGGLGDNIARATTFLESQQSADGGWGGGVSTEAPNTNSTGLVVQALADAGGSPAVIEKGAAYLRSAQVTDTDSGTKLSGDVGAIAYNPADYLAGRTDGITSTDTWLRATAQAGLGLSRASMWDIVRGKVAQNSTTPTLPPTGSPTPSPTTPAPSPTSGTGQAPGSSTPTSTDPGRVPSSTSSATPSKPSEQPASPSAGGAREPQPSAGAPAAPPPAAGGASTYQAPAGPVGNPGLPPVAGRNTVVSGHGQPVVPPTKTGVVAGSPTAAGRLGTAIATSLVDGDHIEVTENGTRYVDYDATADAVLALRALGEQPAAVNRATAFLLDPKSVQAYAHGAPYEKSAATYVEPSAKLLVIARMAQLQRFAVPALSSTIADLKSELANAQGTDGTFEDSGSYPDRTDSVRRHSWAGLALLAVGDTRGADTAAEALVSRQCSDGRFAPNLAQKSCGTGTLDSTSYAVVLLNSAQATAPGVRNAGFGSSAAQVPAGWTRARLSAVRKSTAALQVAVSGGLVHSSAQPSRVDVPTTAAVAMGRQSLGVDTTDTVTAMDPLVGSNGLIKSVGTASNSASSIAAAPAVAGRGWTAAAVSPVARAVVVPAMAATTASSSPQSSVELVSDPSWWERFWPLIATALGALAVGLMIAPRARSVTETIYDDPLEDFADQPFEPDDRQD